MINRLIQIVALAAMLAWVAACQNGSVEHLGTARLVILEPIPVTEGKFDEDFRASLELLYPFECHDSVFIQDQVFLDRIDLKPNVTKEFAVASNLLRDFFGSNNPGKKQALREVLFYHGDTCFEKKPGAPFLEATQSCPDTWPALIGDYLSRNRKNSLVYLFSEDTLCVTYPVRGREQVVHHDVARLNCRIVSDLREHAPKALIEMTVIILVIPSGDPEPGQPLLSQDEGSLPPMPGKRAGKEAGRLTSCPPDSAIVRVNKERRAIITEFRNLLHYIATSSDAELKRKYREDARAEIYRIKDVIIEGIPRNDLTGFLNSPFSKMITVDATYDRCGQISGVHIGGR